MVRIRLLMCCLICCMVMPCTLKASVLLIDNDIRTDGGRYRYTEKQFLVENPGIKIAFVGEELSQYRNAPEMTAAAVDILLGDTRTLRRLALSGQLEPLWNIHKNTGIDPWVQCVIGDKVFAIKEDTHIYTLSPNKRLLNTIGIERPNDQWTWLDLFKLSNEVIKFNNEVGTDYALIREEDSIPLWVKQYCANEFSLESGSHRFGEVFKEMLCEWKILCDAGMSVDAQSSREALFSVSFGIPAQINDGVLRWMPVYQDNIRPHLLRNLCWVVPKDALNVENAVRFLEIYASDMALEHSSRATQYCLTPSNNEWIRFAQDEAVEWSNDVPNCSSIQTYRTGTIKLDECIEMLDEEVKHFLSQKSSID